MSDYIERERARFECKRFFKGDEKAQEDCEALLCELPAADVVPVRRGHWERHKNIVQCSRCGFGMFPIDYAFDRGDCIGINVIPGHCPNCGAELKEVDA